MREVQLRWFFSKYGQLTKERPQPDGKHTVGVSWPGGIDRFVWRAVTHERSRTTLQEVEQYFSVDDLIDLHLVLDMYDELSDLVSRAQRAES